MERRNLLVSIAAGGAGAMLAVGPVLAQAAGAADAPPSGLSDAAKAHFRDTMALSAQSLLVSRIALTKLRHPMTRQFAGFEVTEQDVMVDVLRTRKGSGAKATVATAPPTDAEVEARLDAAGMAAAAEFRDMAAGPEFERAYVRAQVLGHQKLLAVQEAYLQSADDETETAIAKLGKGRVQEHLVLLGDIGRHLG